MTKKEKYTYNVQQCIKAITKEVNKLVFQSKNKLYRERMICLVIADEAKKFKLKYSYMKVIYLGKSNLKN